MMKEAPITHASANFTDQCGVKLVYLVYMSASAEASGPTSSEAG